MGEGLVETFFDARLVETRQDRAYWLSRPWIDPSRRPGALAAPVVVLPWEGSAEADVTYPTGAPEFIRALREHFGDQFEVVVPTRPEDYAELLLHSREWRIPKLLIRYVVVPLLVSLLSDKITSLVPDHRPGDTINMELVVEGENHRCLSVNYKGPADAIPGVVLKQIERCQSYLTKPVAEARR